MRNSILFVSLYLCTFMFLIISCKEDDDIDPTAAASEFVGTYDRIIDCGSGSYSEVDLKIVLAAQDNQIVLEDALGDGFIDDELTATVSGNEFTFSGQYTSDWNPDDDWSVTGTGTISSNKQKVTMEYTVTVSNGTGECTATLTRQ